MESGKVLYSPVLHEDLDVSHTARTQGEEIGKLAAGLAPDEIQELPEGQRPGAVSQVSLVSAYAAAFISSIGRL